MAGATWNSDQPGPPDFFLSRWGVYQKKVPRGGLKKANYVWTTRMNAIIDFQGILHTASLISLNRSPNYQKYGIQVHLAKKMKNMTDFR